MSPAIPADRIQLDAVATKQTAALVRFMRSIELDERLRTLVSTRASQINGCAFCLDMHWEDALAVGESKERIYSLDAWRESPYYTDRERAALEWTEAVTRIAKTHADDEIYEKVKPHFTEKELVDLTFIIATINSWNRIAIAMRSEAGKYQPPKPSSAARVTV